MAGETRCFTPVLGKRLRATQLDNCGRVPESAATDAMASTDGFITVSLSASVEDGTEIITKKADGSMCVNEMTDPSFKRFTAELEFCGVDPGLLSLVTNASLYEDYEGDTAGFTMAEGTIRERFSLELWTGLSGAGCEEGDDEASGYLLLPYVHGGTLDDLTIDGENAVTFKITGAFTRGGNAWGKGPYKVMGDNSGSPAVASVLPTALDPLDHLLIVQTGVAPPESACGLQDMPTAA